MEDQVSFYHKWLYRLLCLLVCIQFPLITLLLVHFYFKADPTHFISLLEDASIQYHETGTFTVAGFKGGYYTINEEPAAAKFSRFYTWGFFYPMLYGSIGKIIGWNFETPFLINMIWISLATGLYIYLARPNSWQLFFIGAFLFTNWNILFYIPSVMQESLHHGITLALAGILYLLMTKREYVPIGAKFLILAFIFVASLLRFTWGFFFIPTLLLSFYRPHRKWHLLGLILLGGVLSGLVFFLFQAFGALYRSPHHVGIFYSDKESPLLWSINDIRSMWKIQSEILKKKLAGFQEFRWDVMPVYQATGLGVALAIMAILKQFIRLSWSYTQISFHLFILVGILSALILFINPAYLYGRYVVSFLMVSLLLCIAFRQYTLVIIFILTSFFLSTSIAGGGFWRCYRASYRL